MNALLDHLETWHRLNRPEFDRWQVVGVEHGEHIDVEVAAGHVLRIYTDDLLGMVDAARRMLDRVQDHALDAIEAHERTLCHWCGVRLHEDEVHCGADLCARRYEAEQAAEAVDG